MVLITFKGKPVNHDEDISRLRFKLCYLSLLTKQKNEQRAGRQTAKGIQDLFYEKFIALKQRSDKFTIKQEKPARLLKKRMFTCDICQKTLQINSKSRHMKLHLKDKPFKCELCNFQSVQLYSIERHFKRKHSDQSEKTFECHLCDAKFFTNYDLKVHVKAHSKGKPKPHKCPQCEYSFFTPSLLKIHMRTHTGEKPYECNQCDYAAAVYVSLKGHMDRHHNKENILSQGSQYPSMVYSKL